jgi:hypothetical protein
MSVSPLQRLVAASRAILEEYEDSCRNSYGVGLRATDEEWRAEDATTFELYKELNDALEPFRRVKT